MFDPVKSKFGKYVKIIDTGSFEKSVELIQNYVLENGVSGLPAPPHLRNKVTDLAKVFKDHVDPRLYEFLIHDYSYQHLDRVNLRRTHVVLGDFIADTEVGLYLRFREIGSDCYYEVCAFPNPRNYDEIIEGHCPDGILLIGGDFRRRIDNSKDYFGHTSNAIQKLFYHLNRQ